MAHVVAYHAALARLADDPLTLTAADFDVFLEFGGPREVKRVRAQVEKHLAQQLGVVKETSRAIEVKAASASAAPHPWRRDPVLLDEIAGGIVQIAKLVKTSLEAKVHALERELAHASGRIHGLETEVGSLKQVVDELRQPRAIRRSA